MKNLSSETTNTLKHYYCCSFTCTRVQMLDCKINITDIYEISLLKLFVLTSTISRAFSASFGERLKENHFKERPKLSNAWSLLEANWQNLKSFRRKLCGLMSLKQSTMFDIHKIQIPRKHHRYCQTWCSGVALQQEELEILFSSRTTILKVEKKSCFK